MALGDLFSSGRSLGQATGSIRIDTGQAEAAVPKMRTIGRDIGRSMSPASQGVDELINRIRRLPAEAQKARRSLADIGKGIQSLRGEIAALGLGAAVLTKIGLDTAANLEDARIVLEDMVGSTGEANALMERLREQAGKAGIPFGDLLQASRQLLPTLNRNTDELEKWIPIVRRVATLNRSEGITGAAFAINEAISSGGTDLVSLSERFNISRQQLRAALEQTGGDFAGALDLVLTRMGVLETTADKMGNTFRASLNRAKDATSQLLAAGLQPLLETLTPILQRTAEWANRLRETNPEVVKLGGGLIAATAAGAPLLLVLGQVLETMQKLKALGALSIIGKGGVLGAAAAVGAGGGLLAGRGIGQAIGNETIANTTASDVMTTIKRIVLLVATGMSELITRLKTGVNNAVGFFIGGVSKMVVAMGAFIQGIGRLLPENLGGQQLDQTGQNVIAFGERLQQGQANIEEYNQALRQEQARVLNTLSEFLGLGSLRGFGSAESAGGAGAGAGGVALAVPTLDLSQFDQQIEEATQGYRERVADIEARANEQRVQATRQYEQQRTSIIADFNLQRLREAQDFARQRARAEQEFNRQLADILAERTEREAEWAGDLAERIADIRQDGNDRIAEMEEAAARERERRERDHRYRLLDAARRLDATAVANEQRSFGTTQSDAAADLARRIEQERVNLEERIVQEQEGHTRRLEQSRAADEQRIADMIEQFERQKAVEDEERAIALKRQREDHGRQLSELARANQEQLKELQTSKQKELATLASEHAKQLAEIQAAKQAEIAAFEEANATQLAAVKTSEDAKLLAQQEGQEKALTAHQEFWLEASRLAREAADNLKGDPSLKSNKPAPVVIVQGSPGSYQAGGFVRRTGPAILHGTRSRPEFVLSPETTAAVRGMIGNNFTQGQLLSALAGGGRGGGITIAPGAIQVHAAPGQDAAMIATAVRREFEGIVRELLPA